MPLLSATPARATEQRSLRFLLAIQRSRVVAYSLAGAVALVGKAAGVLEVGYGAWLSVAAGMVSAVLVEAVIRRDPDRRLRLDANLASMLLDSGLITWGVCATGGLQSPWFLWYLSNAGAAAFTSGRKGAVLVAGVNTLAYMGALFWMGQIRGLDAGFWQAVVGMAFLFAAAYSCLRGVSRLQDSRAQLRRLREDEHLKVDELIRLTQDLDQGTRALAEANLQIREADRVKSQFLANMSHELRTPLNSIIGFSEILRERLADDLNPRHLKFLANIHSSGQHLLGIINDILDLSKVEAGKMEVNAEELAAIPAVEGVLGVMQGMAGKRGITFEVDAPPDLPPIETDPAKFKQILYNLLSNAVKFSPEGEVVRIELRAQLAAESPLHEDSLSLAVVDRGIGIAPEDLEVIFHEFRQADGTVGRAFGGTGLGQPW